MNCVAYSPDGQTLASGSNDFTIMLWNAEPGYQQFDYSQTFTTYASQVFALAFSPDGSLLASGYTGGLKLWSVSGATCLQTISSYPAPASLACHLERCKI